MDNYQNLPLVRKYVSTKKDKDISKLEKYGDQWTKVFAENRLSYEIDWLGVPIIQTPEDLILMQELIFRIRPDFIVETGIAHGGSLIYYASLMELLGKGNVIGIDIEIREHNRKAIEAHPLYKRIRLIECDSGSQDALRQVHETVPEGANVIVCLDSNHTRGHVLKELELYETLVQPGGYMVVFDTVISRIVTPDGPEKQYVNNSPREAIDDFLKKNSDFEIDYSYNKLYISSAPDGYLRRKE